MTEKKWTEERERQFAELYAAGLDSSTIARQMDLPSYMINSRFQLACRRRTEAYYVHAEAREWRRFWSDERVAQLRAMHDEGKSQNFIAEKLGTTVGAVAGKLERLRSGGAAVRKAQPRPPAQKPAGQTKPPKKPPARDLPERLVKHIERSKPRLKETRSRLSGLVMPGDGVPRPIKPPPLAPDLSDEYRVTLMELNNRTCRYPLGGHFDEVKYFCGRPQADLANHRPYCPACARLAYNGLGRRAA